MDISESAESVALVGDTAVRPHSWVESACLWHDHFYKAREGKGSQGDRACLGRREKKRALQGHQLEQTETEHSWRSCYMLSRCLSGTDSYYISAKEVLEIKVRPSRLHDRVTMTL